MTMTGALKYNRTYVCFGSLKASCYTVKSVWLFGWLDHTWIAVRLR
jgi:hypothetical protein